MSGKYNNEFKNESVGRLIKSIANEERSLGNILYQEGRKINRALCMTDCVDEIIKIDDSVQDTLKEIAKAEMLLLQKLEEAKTLNCKDCICN